MFFVKQSLQLGTISNTNAVDEWKDELKIAYDPIHDLLNIEFVSEQPIAESIELDGIIIDYSEDRRIVAIEILDAGKRTTKDPLDLINLAIVKEKVAA